MVVKKNNNMRKRKVFGWIMALTKQNREAREDRII
jgi:hypothetical protein